MATWPHVGGTRRVRIAVDARELVGAVTGSGRYLGQLVAHWDATPGADRHEFLFYAHDSLRLPASRLRAERHVLSGDGGTRWEQTTFAARLRRDRPDVLFAPAYSAPLLTRVPTALAVHDVSFAAHPEWFRPREGARRRFVTGAAARRARIVLTLSEFSKGEIIRWLRVDPPRVRVVPLGLGMVPDDDARGTAPGPRTLVLFVGSVFNRRHVPSLIRAMPSVIARHPAARLSIVGENRTWPHEDLAAIARESSVAERTAIESFVPDGTLRATYAAAGVFVFLSEYEGFGLTPLEALAAGVPIVVLDTPVAREVYGEAARYVSDPEPSAVADAVSDLLEEGPARHAVLAAAPGVLARYRWRDAARATLAAIEEAGS
jgi:glycosyltransferase involved in cell wall biosynthesis